MPMTISEAAGRAGVNVQTLRYYERRGIIEDPGRTAAGYRQYGEAVVTRIRFIKRAQDLGFTLDEVQDLLDLRVENGNVCESVRSKAETKLAHVEAKIEQLARMRDVLGDLVTACERRQTTEDCPILCALEE